MRAGLIDEVSRMLVPAIEGIARASIVFDGAEADASAIRASERLTLESHEVLDNGIVWLRYRVANGQPS